VQELTTEQAGAESHYKLSYIRFLLRKFAWENTKIDDPSPPPQKSGKAQKGKKISVKSARLTRLDGVPFPLVARGVLFYVVFEVTGLELIYVEEIYWKMNGGSHELTVDYTRVLSTKAARDECKGESDLETEIKAASSVVRTRRLGGRSLEAAVNMQANSSSFRLTFHRGDVIHTIPACNIVGFIGWGNVPSDRCSVSAAEDADMAKELLQQIRRTHPNVKTIKDIDWVYCGCDFSDQDSE
jgi:hypothetical protein